MTWATTSPAAAEREFRLALLQSTETCKSANPVGCAGGNVTAQGYRYALGAGFTTFGAGEDVNASFDGDVTPGAYTITRLLPPDGSDPQYRVKNANEVHERTMKESQLRKD